MDCFVAEFIIGPAEGRTRWLLAMTVFCSRRLAGLPEIHHTLPGRGHQAREIPACALDVRRRRLPVGAEPPQGQRAHRCPLLPPPPAPHLDPPPALPSTHSPYTHP